MKLGLVQNVCKHLVAAFCDNSLVHPERFVEI